MDIPFDQPRQNTAPRLSLRISVETLVYVGLFAFGLVLRVVALGDVPLDDQQAHEALAALRRVNLNVAGDPVIADNPLMAFFNQINFFLLDTSNITARLATALVGAFLVWGPWLWRGFLGRMTALIMATLLAISPVALTSARTMSGVTWTMTLIFIGVWLMARTLATNERRYAIASTVTFGAILLLTEPTGIVTLMGLVVGVLVASAWRPPEGDETYRQKMKQALQNWPWLEGLLAFAVLALVIGTGFFTVPGGLTAVGNTLYQFADGLVERPTGTPMAFGLLVALRYDFGLVLFGLVGLYFALSEGGFFSRFLSGWLVWSILTAILYAGATPDAALWIVVPAAGLTATVAARMLRNPSTGYWIVPGWAVPVQAAITAVLVVAIALNGVRLARVLQREAQPAYFHFPAAPTTMSVIGTFDEMSSENTIEFSIVEPTTITLQLWRLDDAIDPVLRLETSAGGLYAGPFSYPEERRGLVQQLQLQPDTYRLKVAQASDSYSRGQFALLSYSSDVEQETLLGQFKGYKLDLAPLRLFTRALTEQNMPSIAIVVVIFLLMLLIIIYFLAGSLWGTRAAWRGLGFGLLIYFAMYGLGAGWQASMTFAEDPRELWQTQPINHQVNRLADTLEEMSRIDTGIYDQITITVQGPDDGALAWALRDFDHVEYVDGLGIEVDSGAVIAPIGEIQPVLGADYVGQDFTISEAWSLRSLNWTDFVAWLALRETRFAPTSDGRHMLWVRKDIYGVQEVTAP